MITLLWAALSAAPGSFVDGNTLYDFCAIRTTAVPLAPPSDRCTAYIAGVVDASVTLQDVLKRRGWKPLICLPRDTTLAPVVQGVRTYLASQVASKQYSAASIVSLALMSRYACQAANPGG